ncbi:TetR/AcrR family transcriptional regulator [Streptomyces sp. NBC_01012]|uniref:TetR/AcrR family transcriptional regulator n=1 Tax=Streptomyces sp. NBC_01012 TaxID=2903717 RepID=UPI00386662B0|nr:TetR/AcrR family transcriptional regulator [Streptomyces sp. NBC_01012]
MSSHESDPPRARVAEARRNRRTLIAVATRAFASGERRVPLDAIAKEAGVGIGTLYRHFPTREALVEAVYHDRTEHLRSGAEELLAAHPPAHALRLWMDLFAEWAVTKHGMIETLRAVVSSGKLEYGRMREELVEVVRMLLDAGVAAGDIRADVDASDVGATLAGILAVAGAPEQRDQAARMLDLLRDGLRPSAASG